MQWIVVLVKDVEAGKALVVAAICRVDLRVAVDDDDAT